MSLIAKSALPFALIGLLIIYSSFFISPSVVHSLDSVPDDQLVVVEGVISDVSLVGKELSFLVDSISFRCDCNASYTGRLARVYGRVDSFSQRRFVRVLSLQLLD